MVIQVVTLPLLALIAWIEKRSETGFRGWTFRILIVVIASASIRSVVRDDRDDKRREAAFGDVQRRLQAARFQSYEPVQRISCIVDPTEGDGVGQ